MELTIHNNYKGVVLKTQVEDLFPIGLILTSDLQ